MTSTPTYKGKLQRLLASSKEGDVLLETNSITKVTSMRATAKSLGITVSAVGFEKGKPVIVDGLPGWRVYVTKKPSFESLVQPSPTA